MYFLEIYMTQLKCYRASTEEAVQRSHDSSSGSIKKDYIVKQLHSIKISVFQQDLWFVKVTIVELFHSIGCFTSGCLVH